MTKKLTFGILLASLIFTCVGLITLGVGSRPAMAAGSERPIAPDWRLKDVNGAAVKSSDFKGKIVILDFWATWCPPCREEIPGFIELQKQYGNQGLVVVGVSLDQGGPALVKRFMERFKINYPVVMGGDKIANDFGGISAIPTTFVLDREGRIVSKHIGYVEKAVFEREVEALL